MKNLYFAFLVSLALFTACGEQNKNEETEEKVETAIDETKSDIKETAKDVSATLKKSTYDFSNKTTAELNKMLEESNKLFEDTKAGLESAEKIVQESAGDAKLEAENIRDQHQKRVDLITNRIEAIKAAINDDNN